MIAIIANKKKSIKVTDVLIPWHTPLTWNLARANNLNKYFKINKMVLNVINLNFFNIPISYLVIKIKSISNFIVIKITIVANQIFIYRPWKSFMCTTDIEKGEEKPLLK